MTTPARGSFVQGINLTEAISLVVGSMIGSGIFIVSADIGRQTGAAGLILLVWGITALVTVMGALTQTELVGMFPKAGGQYVFLREGLGPLWGFLYGWTLLLVIQTGTIAAVAVAFSRFLGVLVPSVTPDVFLSFGHIPALGDVLFSLIGQPPANPQTIELGLSVQRVIGIITVVFITWINVRGVRQGAWLQTMLTGLKVLGVGGLILIGLTIGRQPAVAAQNFGHLFDGVTWSMALVPVLGAAMVGSLFSSDAWNNVAFAAGEVQNPKRNLPLAMVLGTTIVGVIYLLSNVAYLSVLPLADIQNAPQDRVATAAMQVVFGDTGRTLMAVLIMISTFGCNVGLILAGARVSWAMARDGLFFRAVGTLDPVRGTPKLALWVQCLWTCVLAISGTYGQLLDYVIFAAVLFYFLTCVALFRLRFTRPDAERPVKTFLYPVLPAVYLLLTGTILVVLLIEKPLYTWPGLFIVALGVPVYFIWKKMGSGSMETSQP